jgi:tyrosyl-tRNA synthetase
VTSLVHGESACADAIRASEILFGGGLDGINERVFKDVVGEVPTIEIDRAKLDAPGMPIVDSVVAAALSPSKGQARKDVEAGGISVNNVRVGEVARTLTSSDLLFGRHILLRKGKRNYAVLSVR